MGKRFDYALILFEYLKKNEGIFSNIRTIAEQLNLPYAYLEKVAQELKRLGLIEAKKGLGGGYRLNKNKAVSISTLMNLYNPMRSFCPVLRKIKSIEVQPR